MRLPHVCGEVIKELVVAAPPVNRTKGSVAEVSQGFGGSEHKGAQPSVRHWTLCSQVDDAKKALLLPPAPSLFAGICGATGMSQPRCCVLKLQRYPGQEESLFPMSSESGRKIDRKCHG